MENLLAFKIFDIASINAALDSARKIIIRFNYMFGIN